MSRYTQNTQVAGLLAGVALLVMLVSACGDDDDGQPAASVAPPDLAGTKWVLSSYVADDEDVDAAAVAALDFGADGSTLSGTTGCNSVGGTYTQDGSNLTINLGPMTLVACTDDATNAQERAIVDGLPHVASFTAAGQLALLDDKGAALLIYDPNTAGLEGTSWIATGVNNGSGGVEATTLTATISATFAPASALSGFSGCNQYNAAYETSGTDGLTISNVATTRKACADEAMTLESQYTAALAKVTTYSISGVTLTLRDAGGATQVTFTAAS
jgi:heat shock protein HslJ